MVTFWSLRRGSKERSSMKFVSQWAMVVTSDERGAPYSMMLTTYRDMKQPIVWSTYIFDVSKVNKSYCNLKFT